jgi:hypothetical protein
MLLLWKPSVGPKLCHVTNKHAGSEPVLPCQSNTVLTTQPLTVQEGTLKLPITNTVWHILQCHYVGGFGPLVTAVQTAVQDRPYTTPLDQTPQYVAAASAVFEPASAVLGAAAAGDPPCIAACTSCCCHGCLCCCRLLRLRTHTHTRGSQTARNTLSQSYTACTDLLQHIKILEACCQGGALKSE